MAKEGRAIAGKTESGKKKAAAKRKTAEEKRFDKLTSSLTEELFEIAIGQADSDGSKGACASLSERLKAAELLARYRKSSCEVGNDISPAVIIDDIE